MSRIVKDKIRFKSQFEELIANTLGDGFDYEPDTLGYVQPEKVRKYTPDFKLRPDVYIEAKGLFTHEDRQKMLWVKEQYPEKTFYLLFQNANGRITKSSKTTYAMWAEKNGFEWGHMPKGIPKHWLTSNEHQPDN
jgi:hypothetical protein